MPENPQTPAHSAVRPAPPSQRAILNSQPPPSIPDHELLRCIGRGSYGEVWLARNVLGDFRAVKVVYRDRFEHERPYEREFEGIRKFEPISRLHDSQVDILHVGRNDEAGYFYYVMELADSVSGSEFRVSQTPAIDRQPETRNSKPETYVPHTLKLDLHRRARLPVDECVTIALALTTAVQHLHEHGLVHRDIKPSNIIFVGGVPKLADIGLVASMDQTMSFVGTSGYLPPEGPGTPQADLYSLGKVLYEISTGRDRTEFPKLPPELIEPPVPLAHRFPLPSDGREGERSSLTQSELSSGKEANFQPGTRNSELGTTALLELNAVILKACAHDPRQRYQSAPDMAADLALLQRGQSVKRKQAGQRRLALLRKFGLAAVAVMALIALWPYVKLGKPQRNGAARAELKSIAVLPFENESAEQADEYFAPQMVEEIANALAKIPELRVLGRSSATALKGSKELRKTAERLKLAAILEGRVRKSGDQLHLSVQLINSADGFVIWSDVFDGGMKNVFGLQTRLAENVAQALGLKLSDSIRARLAMKSTKDLQAHQAYLEGRFHWHRRDQASLKMALEKFKRAIVLDPDYAQAHAGLADTLSIWEDVGLGASREAMPQARAAAQKAIALDDELAEAHAALGKVLMLYDWNWPGAERAYRRAIQLDPNYPTARQGYAQCLDVLGRSAEALEQIQKGVELDPLAPIMHVNLIVRLYYQRRYAEAVECWRRSRELYPNFGNNYFGRLFEDTRRYDLAVEEWVRAFRNFNRESDETIAELQAAYAASGIHGFWRTRLKQLQEKAKQGQFVPARSFADLYARLGEDERTLEFLEKMLDERNSSAIFIHREPAFFPLRSHPHFVALVKRLGLDK